MEKYYKWSIEWTEQQGRASDDATFEKAGIKET